MPCSRPTGTGRTRRYRQQPQPHICPLCKKHFSTGGHLKRHVQIHSGQRNFPCTIPGCETRCSRADNLQQHIKTHSPSYVPRKAPKDLAFGFSSASSSSSTRDSPRPSTWSSYSQSSAEYSPPPTTPPSFTFPSSMPTRPVVQVPEIPGFPLLPLEPVELFRPKLLLVENSNITTQMQPSSAVETFLSATFPPYPHLELVHPIPRASQPRSTLLDLEDSVQYESVQTPATDPNLEPDFNAFQDLLAYPTFLASESSLAGNLEAMLVDHGWPHQFPMVDLANTSYPRHPGTNGNEMYQDFLG
ncbi:hypothetical protein MIND_00210100 [Mycena indigotica]|uniref:C2H2-type domain-containing protein n=1 Tax=Mycena indigotica TaxID=2126181 RepID=A0A8H6T578_9AGAR|nr:uncharacterized protein MIND_00210100 [Mycena indigotica]KAF7311983.1 hypothetical protein MIND_00210100 [Mycena indigotica]